MFLVGFFISNRWMLAEKKLLAATRAGSTVEAIELIKESVNLHSTDIAHGSLSNAYLKDAVEEGQKQPPNLSRINSDLTSAISEARRALDISPDSVGLWLNLANVYDNAAVLVPDARKFAINATQNAHNLEPYNPEHYYRLGYYYEQMKDWQNAIVYYEEAVKLNPDYNIAKQALVGAYEQIKQTDKALSLVQEDVSGNPGDVAGQYNYGRLLYNRNLKGDRDEAEQIWQNVLKINPNYSNALFSLGVLYEIRKNYPKALNYFYKVRDLNPLKNDNSNADAVKAINDKINLLLNK